MDAILPAKPSSYKKLMKYSFRLYKASLPMVLLPAYFLALIAYIPLFLSSIAGQSIYLGMDVFNPYRLWSLLINIISLIFFISIFWHMHCVIRGLHEPFFEDLTKGLRKVFFVFVAIVVQSLIIFAISIMVFGMEKIYFQKHAMNLFQNIPLAYLFSCCQIVLIFYVAVLFCFILPLITIENKGVFSAMRKSAHLVWNHWWRVFSVQLTPWLMYALVITAFQYTFKLNLHIYFFDYARESVLSLFFDIILFTLFIPWVSALLLLQAHDLELRKRLLETDSSLDAPLIKTRSVV